MPNPAHGLVRGIYVRVDVVLCMLAPNGDGVANRRRRTSRRIRAVEHAIADRGPNEANIVGTRQIGWPAEILATPGSADERLRSRGGDERSTIQNPPAIVARVHRLVRARAIAAWGYNKNGRWACEHCRDHRCPSPTADAARRAMRRDGRRRVFYHPPRQQQSRKPRARPPPTPCRRSHD